MGQAKRRGTFEWRRSKAIALREALLERQNMALTKPLPTTATRQEVAAMTSLKHIEEARRLAAETENAIIAILSPEMGSNEIYAQILKHIPLPTLLAAQEELETTNLLVQGLEGNLKACEAELETTELNLELTGKTVLVRDETITKLRAELEKWKLGCETNADCYRTAVRAQDEQRLELIKLRAELAMANDAADKGKAGRELGTALEEAVKENAELRAERDELENKIDDQWLDAIARQWLSYSGKPWETRDGETPEEGRSANINGLFVEIERLQTHNVALLAVARAVKEQVEFWPHHTLRNLSNAVAALEPLGIKLLP